jgi:hypothetical protein
MRAGSRLRGGNLTPWTQLLDPARLVVAPTLAQDVVERRAEVMRLAAMRLAIKNGGKRRGDCGARPQAATVYSSKE